MSPKSFALVKEVKDVAQQLTFYLGALPNLTTMLKLCLNKWTVYNVFDHTIKRIIGYGPA